MRRCQTPSRASGVPGSAPLSPTRFASIVQQVCLQVLGEPHGVARCDRWRRRRDSNPRCLSTCRFLKPTNQPPTAPQKRDFGRFWRVCRCMCRWSYAARGALRPSCRERWRVQVGWGIQAPGLHPRLLECMPGGDPTRAHPAAARLSASKRPTPPHSGTRASEPLRCR